MSDSDQRAGWTLSARRGRSQTPIPSPTLERSPSKLSRLLRGISDSKVPQASTSTAHENLSKLESSARSYDPDGRRNAVLLDVHPADLRPPSEVGSLSTFSIISPPSPPPDSLQYQFRPLSEPSKTDQNLSLDILSRSASKRFLPKFRTSLSGSSKSSKLFSRRRKRRTVSYELDGEPLDGEEGELIDDEACFMDPSQPRGMDILRMLPDELSIYILLFLDVAEILSCLRVSRHWQRLAGDQIVWRGFYYRAGFSINLHAVKQAGMQVPSTPATPLSPPLSSLSRLTYYLPAYSSSIRTSATSLATQQSLESSIRFPRYDTSVSHAPLSLDWKTLYKTRIDVESRMANADRPPALFKLVRHSEPVYCVEFDGETIITGSRDRKICVWSNLNNKPKLRMTLSGHSGSVLCLQFDHTGFMVSGSSDSTVIVWDLTAEPEKCVVEVLRAHQGGVLDIKIDPKRIVSCSKDTRICVWTRASNKLETVLHGHHGPVNAIGLQGDRVVSVSGDGKMILWDIISGQKIRMFEGHERGLASVVYKDDILISGSNDRKIKVWDVRTGECLKTLSGHDDLVRALSFDSGTMRLVSASYDRSIRIWDIRTGKVLREFPHVHGGQIFDVVFHVSKIISASHDKQVIIMDFATDLDTSLFN